MPKQNPSDDALPAPILALSSDQFATLLETFQKTAGTGTPTPELTQILDVMRAMVEANTANTSQIRDQVKRAVPAFNADHEHVSAFTYKHGCAHCADGTRHPEDPTVVGSGKLGHPPVPLAHDEVYWPYGCRVWPDQCTILEVELMNQFVPGRSYYARERTWRATWSDDKRKLVIDAPVWFSDDRNAIPALPQVLTELLYGQEAADPMVSLEVIADLKRRIADLEGRTQKVEA